MGRWVLSIRGGIESLKANAPKGGSVEKKKDETRIHCQEANHSRQEERGI